LAGFFILRSFFDSQLSFAPLLVNVPYPASSNASQFATWFLKFHAYEPSEQNEGG
jgi:hypothetical protein